MLPEHERAKHLGPEALWRIDECHLIVVNDGAFPDKVDFKRLEESRALDKFPAEVGNGSWDLG